MNTLSEEDKDTIYQIFHTFVNLSSMQLADWLETIESHSVGVVSGTSNFKKTSKDSRESVGHESGRRILFNSQYS